MHCEVAYGMQWYVQWYDDVSPAQETLQKL